ncbi:MAG: Glycosyl transferase group 1, partial [Candidatus Magasanikbacteria bacterium GW2011_GWC2_45_8]
TPQITCVARLEPQKGHDTLLRALALLDDMAWELVLAGDGSLKEYVIDLARVLNIRERVNYLGARRDIPAILQDTDIFVLPSLWEGLGIVILEAGASAVPVVASNVGGIPEMVVDQETGLLVPPGDVEALSHALRALLQDSVRAREMGTAARARVEQNFALPQTIEKYKMLYESLK